MTLSDSEYFANLTRAVFVTGFSREVITKKWPAFIDAFEGFDPAKVATWSGDEISDLLERDDIVRNTRKIEATVYNAKAFTELISEYGSMDAYVQSLGKDHEPRIKQLQKRFKFVGPTTATIFLYLSGFKVPPLKKK